jgi:hypothetical protein
MRDKQQLLLAAIKKDIQRLQYASEELKSISKN